MKKLIKKLWRILNTPLFVVMTQKQWRELAIERGLGYIVAPEIAPVAKWGELDLAGRFWDAGSFTHITKWDGSAWAGLYDNEKIIHD